MPFQYSLHILHEDGTLEHKEFLGDENSDPRRPLSEQMLKDITPTGSIIAYNQSFEITQIKNLALVCSDISDELLALNERFIDLAHPFQYKHYYHPKFNGKYSIKVVLPTLFPDDDELDYKKLGSVQNGGDAMDTFANLHLLKDKSKLDEIKKDLLAYCHLDTLAMVRIWEKLDRIILRDDIDNTIRKNNSELEKTLDKKRILEKNYMLSQIQKSDTSIFFTPDILLDDKEFVLSLIKFKKELIQFASKRVRSDIDIIHCLLDGTDYSDIWFFYDPENEDGNWMDGYDESILEYVTNRDFVLNLVKEYPAAFVFLSKEFLHDNEIRNIANSDKDMSCMIPYLYCLQY